MTLMNTHRDHARNWNERKERKKKDYKQVNQYNKPVVFSYFLITRTTTETMQI